MRTEVRSNVGAERTLELTKWISRMQRKKQRYCKSLKRNLLIQAVLTSALYKAEFELHNKEVEFINHRKQTYCLKNINHGSGGYNSAKQLQQDNTEINPWKDYGLDELCADLNSLNDFMLQVNQVSSPMQR